MRGMRKESPGSQFERVQLQILCMQTIPDPALSCIRLFAIWPVLPTNCPHHSPVLNSGNAPQTTLSTPSFGRWFCSSAYSYDQQHTVLPHRKFEQLVVEILEEGVLDRTFAWVSILMKHYNKIEQTAVGPDHESSTRQSTMNEGRPRETTHSGKQINDCFGMVELSISIGLTCCCMHA